jgi:hypothetical protein
MRIRSVGIDLGKTTFHLVALSAAGRAETNRHAPSISGLITQRKRSWVGVIRRGNFESSFSKPRFQGTTISQSVTDDVPLRRAGTNTGTRANSRRLRYLPGGSAKSWGPNLPGVPAITANMGRTDDRLSYICWSLV